MARERVMDRVAERFLTHCPAEVCGVKCPMPTDDCADAGEVRLCELLKGLVYLRRAGSRYVRAVTVELAVALETVTPAPMRETAATRSGQPGVRRVAQATEKETTEMPKTPTNADLKSTCEIVLYSKAQGHRTTTVNGVTFDDNIYDGQGGRCQENARKAYEATTGKPMPGKGCCAGRTFRRLAATRGTVSSGRYDESALRVGDYLFMGGGPKCHTCGGAVGHVGIYLGHGRDGRSRVFQHTSRNGLGITQDSLTPDQKRRFLGAFRLLPLA